MVWHLVKRCCGGRLVEVTQKSSEGGGNMVYSLKCVGGVVNSGWRVRTVRCSQFGRFGDCRRKSGGVKTTGGGRRVYNETNIKATNIKRGRCPKLQKR